MSFKEIQYIKKFRFPQDYDVVHKKRFESILAIIHAMPNNGKELNILEIGTTNFSVTLNREFANLTTIDLNERTTELDEKLKDVPHITFDLCKSYDKTMCPEYKNSFDVIIFAEVLEHLPIAPENVLSFLYTLLKENGKIILQTPNACALHKRVLMLFGFNPFDRIIPNLSIDSENKQIDYHGHIREYTRKELYEISKGQNFTVIYHKYKNYLNTYSNWKKPLNYIIRLFLFLSAVIPQFRLGQTMVLEKDSQKEI